MGWGLKVAEDVSKGSLVGEYVGEVKIAFFYFFHVGGNADSY